MTITAAGKNLDVTTFVKLLNEKNAKELCTLFNRVTGSSVKRFATKTAGLNRLYKLFDDPSLSGKLGAILAAEDVGVAIIEEFDDGTPIESAAEVLTKVAKKIEKKQKKNKELSGPQPIKDSDLVSFKGRVIRPENAPTIERGDDLWGSCGKPPTEKDRMRGAQAQLNLNYSPKKRIVEARKGTMRYKLLRLMEGKGVTVPQVAKLFNITEQAAIYKLRDLHYVGGNGLRVIKGRVFIYS